MPADIAASRTDYSRLQNTAFAQDRVTGLRGVVVGAGALGNEVVKNLGLIGFGSVLLVDPDVVEPANLTRSLFFRNPDCIGRSKAETMAASARQLFPDTKFAARAVEIADLGFRNLEAVDIIFSCVDSDLARLEIAYMSTRLDIPVIDGGLGTADYSAGRVSWFPGRQGACYGCLLGPSRRRELLTLWESTARSCWNGEPAPRERNYSSTPMMASAIASMQVEIGLKRILDSRQNTLESCTMDLSLGDPPRIDRYLLSRGVSCMFHGDSPALVAPPAPPSETTPAMLLDSAPQGSFLLLDWPVCTRAACESCSYSWPTMRRLGWLRKYGRCPQCGAGPVRGEEVIRYIDTSSDWIDYSLSELGQPENHLYTICNTVEDRS